MNVRRTQDPVRLRVRSRGIPPALDRYEIFTTSVITDAERGAHDLLGPHRLRVSGVASAEFQACLHAVRLRDVTFGYLDYHVAVDIRSQCLPDDYFVFMPTNGQAIVHTRDRVVESSTIVASLPEPGVGLTMEWAYDSPNLFVRIARSALERQLSRLTGHSPGARLVFEPGMSLTSDVASRWHGAMQLLHSEIYHPRSLAREGRGVGPLEDFLISTLLLVQPSNYSHLLHSTADRAHSRTVRHAVDFIESHLGEPMTVGDIAAAASVSERTLQQAFQGAFGMSPTAFLRERRLDRVRDELVDADPSDDTSVTEVAMRWGLTHMGRFAAAYRRRFGETPSQTLRR